MTVFLAVTDNLLPPDRIEVSDILLDMSRGLRGAPVDTGVGAFSVCIGAFLRVKVPERLRRKPERPAAGRVPQRASVQKPAGGATGHRTLADRLHTRRLHTPLRARAHHLCQPVRHGPQHPRPLTMTGAGSAAPSILTLTPPATAISILAGGGVIRTGDTNASADQRPDREPPPPGPAPARLMTLRQAHAAI